MTGETHEHELGWDHAATHRRPRQKLGPITLNESRLVVAKPQLTGAPFNLLVSIEEATDAQGCDVVSPLAHWLVEEIPKLEINPDGESLSTGVRERDHEAAAQKLKAWLRTEFGGSTIGLSEHNERIVDDAYLGAARRMMIDLPELFR